MDEAFIKKVQPNSPEAEQSVIGAMIMDRDAIADVIDIVNADDFYQKQNGILFEAMTELYREGKPVDLVTLQNKLKKKDVPESMKSLEFIRDLLEVVPTSANAKQYATIVREKATLRKLIKVTEDITTECYLGKDDVTEILDHTEKNVFGLLQQASGREEFVPIDKVVLNTLDAIEEAASSAGRVTGIATGFTDLDYKLSGLHPSELIIVAARPAMGKTAFVLNIAQKAAVRDHVPTAIFSLEMSKEQLVTRMMAMEAMVDSQSIRTGDLQETDWEKIMVASWVNWESIEDQRGMAASARQFERYTANRFPKDNDAYSVFKAPQLDRCERGTNKFDFTKPWTLGIDGATAGDSFAIIAYQKRKTKKGRTVCLTKEWVFDTPDEETGHYDFEQIIQLIAGLCSEHWPQVVGIDPNRLIVMNSRLRDVYGIETVSFPQNNATMCQATSIVVNAVEAGELRLRGCPKLRAHLANTVEMNREPYGMRFGKDSKKSKIDAAIALAIAALAYDKLVSGTESYVPVS